MGSGALSWAVDRETSARSQGRVHLLCLHLCDKHALVPVVPPHPLPSRPSTAVETRHSLAWTADVAMFLPTICAGHVVQGHAVPVETWRRKRAEFRRDS